MFTSKLEEVLLAWQLSVKDKEDSRVNVDLNGEWKSVSEDLYFAGNSLS